MAKEMIRLGYTPYKVWLINYANKLAVKGREEEGLTGWIFHVAIMTWMGNEDNNIRMVIDPSLFSSAVSLDTWKSLFIGIEHSSQSQFGERPWVKFPDGSGYYQLPGSYVPTRPDSNFPSMDEKAKETIQCKKDPTFLQRIFGCR